MSNWEWLEALANNSPDELQAWFDSEHVENANATLQGDTAALEAKIAELTAERDKLQEQLRIGWECECRLQAERDELKGQVFTLKVECDDLTSACDDLENELYKVKAERERYREKFGKCIDYADAIHALMDEGMA